MRCPHGNRLRNCQNAAGGGRRNQGRNGLNMALFRPVTEDDLSRDADYSPMVARLNQLREVKVSFEVADDLCSCEKSLLDICQIY